MSAAGTQQSAVVPAAAGIGLAELAGAWEFDPAHSRLGFRVRQVMIMTVTGAFGEFAGGADLDPSDPSKSEVTVTIQANSIRTGNRRRDAHLRAAFFAVQTYPTIEFRSTELRPTDDPAVWTVAGDLTIRGVTRPVELTMTYLGVDGEPGAGARARFAGTAVVNRKQWGVGLSELIDFGGIAVGNHVGVELDVQAIKKSRRAGGEMR